jgi:8-oxo-dGTP pyrophosphatase MutT (NUDIX family)
MTEHSVSVAAVVTDDAGRVLVIQRRDNSAWQIPGGVLERDESIPAGLRREVVKETGLLIGPDRLTGVTRTSGALSWRWCSAPGSGAGKPRRPTRVPLSIGGRQTA